LGLYIADQVVAGHGGRIDVVCENGIVDFAVVLPVGRSGT
jgi:nitrogen-specific signal transduction histidine kinase